MYNIIIIIVVHRYYTMVSYISIFVINLLLQVQPLILMDKKLGLYGTDWFGVLELNLDWSTVHSLLRV